MLNWSYIWAPTMQHPYKHILKLGVLGIIILGLHTSCSTEKTGWAHRSYHNTTARYNGYFNAKESVKEGIVALKDNHEEDYNKVLPIFIYGDETSTGSILPQMERAIEKSSVVIDRHSMPNRARTKKKKVEYCQWIDENYFLIGKAYFYERKFEDARRHLEYVSRAPEYKHTSTRYEAMLWLAKTYIEEEDYAKAQITLDIIEDARKEEIHAKEEAKEDKKKKKKRKKRGSSSRKKKKKKKKKKGFEFVQEGFPKGLKDDLKAVQADIFIRQGLYEEAIAPLEEAIEEAKDKAFKARLLYILAQLHEKAGDKNLASVTYDRVVKLHPDYELEFYARINRALNANTRSTDTKGLKSELLKMLKDDKNSQWFDQIYYVLADLELRDPNEPKAIEYLILSTQTSVENQTQKGLSFLKLGDIYFEKPNYVLAQQYYDSTATYLPKDYEQYAAIANKAKFLTELVTNLQTIERQDSLLNLCNLTDAQRRAIIDDIIAKKIAAEEEAREAELSALNNPTNTGNKPSGGGKEWYYYNPNQLSIGFSEFRRKWGERKAEDNWRRADKSTQLSDFDPEEEVPEEDSVVVENDKTPAFYLKDLPCEDDKKLAASHNDIVEALYNAGSIYKEKLEDNPEAIKSFTDLVTRYDSCKYQLPSYYQLYRLHLAESNQPKANEYKNLLAAFPDSEYYRIIVDPNYKEKDQAKILLEKKNYETALDQFHRGYYTAAMTSVNKVLNNEPKNFYTAKYLMLKAQASSKLGMLEAVEPLLREIITRFPGTEEALQAEKYLNLVKEAEIEEESPFKVNEGANHYFVILFPNTKGSVKHIENKISNYNKVYFKSQSLKMQSMIMGTEDKVITVKTFENKNTAMDYYNAFKHDDGILKGVNDGYAFYVLSQENFQVLYADRDYDGFAEWFKENYEE